MDRNPLFVRTDEAAKLLSVSQRTLEKLRLTGGGPRYCRPPGRRFVIYSVRDLIAWANAGRMGSTSDGAEQ
jgi:hypothetical protein